MKIQSRVVAARRDATKKIPSSQWSERIFLFWAGPSPIDVGRDKPACQDSILPKEASSGRVSVNYVRMNCNWDQTLIFAIRLVVVSRNISH
jgi:hypothetical protein